MEGKDKKRTLLKIVSNDTAETTELTFHTESAYDVGEVAYALIKVFEECPSILAIAMAEAEEKLLQKVKERLKDKSEIEDKEDKISDIDFNKLFFNKNNED